MDPSYSAVTARAKRLHDGLCDRILSCEAKHFYRAKSPGLMGTYRTCPRDTSGPSTRSPTVDLFRRNLILSKPPQLRLKAGPLQHLPIDDIFRHLTTRRAEHTVG